MLLFPERCEDAWGSTLCKKLILQCDVARVAERMEENCYATCNKNCSEAIEFYWWIYSIISLSHDKKIITDRKTDGQKDRQTKQTDWQRDWQRQTDNHRQTDRQTDTHTHAQTYTNTHQQTNNQIKTHTNTHKHTKTHKNTHTNTHKHKQLLICN